VCTNLSLLTIFFVSHLHMQSVIIGGSWDENNNVFLVCRSHSPKYEHSWILMGTFRSVWEKWLWAFTPIKFSTFSTPVHLNKGARSNDHGPVMDWSSRCTKLWLFLMWWNHHLLHVYKRQHGSLDKELMGLKACCKFFDNVYLLDTYMARLVHSFLEPQPHSWMQIHLIFSPICRMWKFQCPSIDYLHYIQWPILNIFKTFLLHWSSKAFS